MLSNQEKNKRWLSYEEAAKACRKAGIKSQNDFNARLSICMHAAEQSALSALAIA